VSRRNHIRSKFKTRVENETCGTEPRKTANAMDQSPFVGAASSSSGQKFVAFKEPEDLLPFLQHHNIRSYSEPVECNPHHDISISILILYSLPRLTLPSYLFLQFFGLIFCINAYFASTNMCLIKHSIRLWRDG